MKMLRNFEYWNPSLFKFQGFDFLFLIKSQIFEQFHKLFIY